MTLVGAFKVNTWVALFATTGVILSAVYALYLYRRVVFGALEKANLKSIKDMNAREIAIMAPLVILTILFGFYPALLLDVMAVSVKQLVMNFEAAVSQSTALNAQ